MGPLLQPRPKSLSVPQVASKMPDRKWCSSVTKGTSNSSANIQPELTQKTKRNVNTASRL